MALCEQPKQDFFCNIWDSHEDHSDHRKNRFLVDVTSNELAQIMGFDSIYSMEAGLSLRYAEAILTVGADINVHKMYRALEVDRNRKKRLNDLAMALHKVGDDVTSINGALDNPLETS